LSKQIPWLRVFVEGAVIVGSILLAFGIDAAWEGRQDDAFELDALTRLEVEFTENLGRIASPRANSGRPAARAAAFHQLLQSLPAATESVAVPDTLIAGVLSTGTFDRVTPVLDGLLRSGRWELIRDPNVREAIALFERWLAQLVERQAFAREHVDMRLRPSLAARGDVSRVFSGYGIQSDLAESDEVTVLRIDDELKAFVAEKHARNESNAGISARLRAATEDVLAAISRSLGS